MPGLVRRLHRLKIQLSLETQSEQTGISYPNVQARKSRADQHSKISKSHNLHDICVNDIITEFLRAKQDALDSLKHLGMTLKLDAKGKDQVYELLEEDVEDIHNDLYGNDSTEVNLEEEMYTENECAEVLREIDLMYIRFFCNYKPYQHLLIIYVATTFCASGM